MRKKEGREGGREGGREHPPGRRREWTTSVGRREIQKAHSLISFLQASAVLLIFMQPDLLYSNPLPSSLRPSLPPFLPFPLRVYRSQNQGKEDVAQNFHRQREFVAFILLEAPEKYHPKLHWP